MSLNLDTLRKIAEAATPGPWEMCEENPQMDGRNFTLRVQGKAGIRMSAHCYGFNGDPEFIATFDPPTVLALLSRLEQAEQQVQRVRELAEAWKSRGEHDMEYSKTIPPDIGEIINEGGAEMVHKANLIDRALDGDTRG